MTSESMALEAEGPAPLSLATRRGLILLAMAGGLGLLADLLLNTLPWGVNVPLWVAAVGLLVWWWSPRLGQAPAIGARWLVAPAVTLAVAFAWRDSVLLGLMNALLVLGCFGLAPVTTASQRFWHAGVGDYLNALVHGAGRGIAAFALPMLVSVRWKDVVGRVTWVWVGPVARGMGLAIPVLVFFASFLLSADPIFQRAMADLFRWDWWVLVQHAVVMTAGFWIGGGLVWHALSPLPRPESPNSADWRVGTVESSIVLNALNLMLLLFTAVQVRYLFGGASVVESSGTLTYAEYARRGFFELVTVGAAALMVLLLAEAATIRVSRRQEWVFRVSAGVLVALVLAVLGSAVQRMLIYQQQYGLTELRIYTVAFMGWMALAYSWFTATTLLGRSRWFAIGALVAALATAGALNVASVDSVITRVNLTRTDFDARYHTRLSADAVPVLIEALPVLPALERSQVAHCLLARWGQASGDDDWRGWNAARDAATKLVAANADDLRRWAVETNCYARQRSVPN